MLICSTNFLSCLAGILLDKTLFFVGCGLGKIRDIENREVKLILNVNLFKMGNVLQMHFLSLYTNEVYYM